MVAFEEGVVSLVSPNSEVDYVVLVYLVVTHLRVRLTTVGAYCLCDSVRHIAPVVVETIVSGEYVGVAEVGFSGELLFALETLYLDYFAHYFSSVSEHPHRTDATATNVL